MNNEEEKLTKGSFQITNLHVQLAQVRTGWGVVRQMAERACEKLCKKSPLQNLVQEHLRMIYIYVQVNTDILPCGSN